MTGATTIRLAGLFGLAAALAGCGGTPCALDGRIDGATCATLQSMALPDALPPSPTNAHADDEAAAYLGLRVFFDARFSSTHKVRCASCHAPETHFDDQRAVPERGIDPGTRNSPSTLNAAWLERSFFWDGRADVLWAPPILALENAHEMDCTRLEQAHALADYYGDAYAPIFGPLPALADATRFPARGKPGDATYDQMAAADRDAIDQVAANLGKSLEAYLRRQAAGRSPFDRYLAGERTALSASQQLGMLVFVSSGCAGCHGGPLLHDGRFHGLGLEPAPNQPADPGRAAGIEAERRQQFAPDGPQSDRRQPIDIAPATAGDAGAFRTPTLRNVALTAPYGHDGRFATLADVVDFHLQGGGHVDPQLRAVTLSDVDRQALLDFLTALTGDGPPPPWNDWPVRP